MGPRTARHPFFLIKSIHDCIPQKCVLKQFIALKLSSHYRAVVLNMGNFPLQKYWVSLLGESAIGI